MPKFLAKPTGELTVADMILMQASITVVSTVALLSVNGIIEIAKSRLSKSSQEIHAV